MINYYQFTIQQQFYSLKIELVESNKMYLKLFGNLRNLQIKNSSEDIHKLHLNIDEANQYFEIDNTVDLSTVINEPKHYC